MGRGTFSRDAYAGSVASFTEKGRSATSRGEQIVKKTGKLDPLVDPAGYGVIRPSRMRMTELESGLWEVSVGAPSTLEYELDTTGSMGDNVERALKVLPQTCELTAEVLPGRDPFYAAAIFGDITDRIVLCRGQFEVLADRMVNQLTLMHPESGGGDSAEDPHYGIYGAAYLTDAYLHRIGLKSMHFVITDAPMHDRLINDQLKRIFGNEVFEKTKENGFTDIDSNNLPSNKELVKDLFKRSHAFALLVNADKGDSVYRHWVELYGKDNVILMPEIEMLPHVMATVTGLTEGTIDLSSGEEFLRKANLNDDQAKRLISKVAHIPLGAQCALPNYSKLPKKGDIFANKTDLFPMNPDDIPADLLNGTKTQEADSGGWL